MPGKEKCKIENGWKILKKSNLLVVFSIAVLTVLGYAGKMLYEKPIKVEGRLVQVVESCLRNSKEIVKLKTDKAGKDIILEQKELFITHINYINGRIDDIETRMQDNLDKFQIKIIDAINKK